MDCHVKATGAPCVGYLNGPVSVFPANVRNTGLPFLYWDDAKTKVYTWSATQNKAGRWAASVSCVDVGVAPPKFCGERNVTDFVGQSTKGWAWTSGGPGGGARIGNKIYAFNSLQNQAPYTSLNNYLLCFDIGTLTPCAGQPWKVPGFQSDPVTPPEPRTPFTQVSGGKIYIMNPVWFTRTSSGGNGWITCWDPAADTQCTGVWPQLIPANEFQRDGHPGSISQQFPYIGPGGEDGICIGGTKSAGVTPAPYCWNSVGQAIGPLPGYKGAGGNPNIPISGIMYDKRWYQAAGKGVSCYDFKTMSACPNFPSTPGFTLSQYCVRSDPYAPGCLWISSHAGDIRNFDAYTGLPGCGALPYGSIAIEPVDAGCARNVTKFLALSVLQPPPSTYASAIVNVTSSLLGKIVLSVPLVNGVLSLEDLDPDVVGDVITVTTSFVGFKCPAGTPNMCAFNASLTYQTTGVTCCDPVVCYNPESTTTSSTTSSTTLSTDLSTNTISTTGTPGLCDATSGFDPTAYSTNTNASQVGDFTMLNPNMPAGTYTMTYVGGCMRYCTDPITCGWTVNSGQLDGWYLGTAPGDARMPMPGAAGLSTDCFGQVAGQSCAFETYDECVEYGKTLSPVEFTFPGGMLGFWLLEANLSDNVLGTTQVGGINPLWTIQKPCG